MIIQLVLSSIAIIGLVLVFKRNKQGILRRNEFFGWLLLWLAGLLIVWVPDVANRLADFAGVGRGADVITYLTLALLVVLVFQLYLSLDRLERRITDFIREDALRGLPKEE